jgi:hypothetical protein
MAHLAVHVTPKNGFPVFNQWQLVQTTDRDWSFSCHTGFAIFGATLRKAEVYAEIAEILFGWLR